MVAGSSATTTKPCDAMKVDRKSTRLNSSHANISYDGFCLKKKQQQDGLAAFTLCHNSSSTRGESNAPHRERHHRTDHSRAKREHLLHICTDVEFASLVDTR